MDIMELMDITDNYIVFLEEENKRLKKRIEELIKYIKENK